MDQGSPNALLLASLHANEVTFTGARVGTSLIRFGGRTSGFIQRGSSVLPSPPGPVPAFVRQPSFSRSPRSLSFYQFLKLSCFPHFRTFSFLQIMRSP